MILDEKKIKFISNALIAVAVLSTLWIFYAIKEEKEFSSKFKIQEGDFLTVYAPEFLTNKTLNYTKVYASTFGVKINDNFVNSDNIEGLIKKVANKDQAAFIGYYILDNIPQGLPNAVDAATIIKIDTTSVIAVTNNALLDNEDVVFKNICQLNYAAQKDKIPFFITQHEFLPQILLQQFSQDCNKICNFFASKIISFSNIDLFDAIEESNKEYVILSNGADFTLSEDERQKHSSAKYGALNMYFTPSIEKEIAYQSANIMQIIDYVLSNKVQIVAHKDEVAAVKNYWLSQCDKISEITQLNYSVADGDFTGKDGILFGFAEDTADLGKTVYIYPKNVDIVGFCSKNNEKSILCEDFLQFYAYQAKKN